MSGNEPSPVDLVLRAMLAREPRSYRATADPHRWEGTCAVCGDWALTITERHYRGPVTLECSQGCAQEAIVAALSRDDATKVARLERELRRRDAMIRRLAASSVAPCPCISELIGGTE